VCRSKVSQLKQGLGPRSKDDPPTFLDFDFVADTSEVKMTVTAGDDDDDDDDVTDDDDVRRPRHAHQQDVDSASVDIGPTPVHS